MVSLRRAARRPWVGSDTTYVFVVSRCLRKHGRVNARVSRLRKFLLAVVLLVLLLVLH